MYITYVLGEITHNSSLPPFCGITTTKSGQVVFLDCGTENSVIKYVSRFLECLKERRLCV